MKILKLKFDKLKQTAANVADKAFIRACSKIALLHNSIETLTGYLFVVNQEFKDATQAMLIIGDLTTTWVKYAKDTKKKDPKNVLWGECFAQKEEDGSLSIQLVNKAGKAKLTALLKLSEVKASLKKAKAEIIWAKGMSDEAEETAGLEDKETMDDKDEARIEEFIDTPADDTIDREKWEDLAEDAAYLKRRMEEMRNLSGDLRKKVEQEVDGLITVFLNETTNIENSLPAKLAKFRAGITTLQAKWQKQKQRKMAAQIRLQMKQIYKAYQAAQ